MVVEKRLERLDKDRKKVKNPELDREAELLEKCKATLEADRRAQPGTQRRRREAIRGFQFLSQKPMLYVFNVGEKDAPQLHEKEEEYRKRRLADEAYGRRRDLRQDRSGAGGIVVAKKKRVSGQLWFEGVRPRASDFGELHAARPDVVPHRGRRRSPRLDHSDDSTAVKAAGAIHSDFEKKFIRAEVVNWKSLVDLGGYPGVREKGLLRLEGKEYIVKDGDVLVIRHG